jgi:hypothetical protein
MRRRLIAIVSTRLSQACTAVADLQLLQDAAITARYVALVAHYADVRK